MSEREQAIEQLREIFPPGSTVYTVRRNTSRSGASHSISVVTNNWKGDGPSDISFLAARAMADKIDHTHGGIKRHGGGMDMGFDLVYTLSSELYPEGFECIGERCPSNDHVNGDRNYAPHHHVSGGYALKHRWL